MEESENERGNGMVHPAGGVIPDATNAERFIDAIKKGRDDPWGYLAPIMIRTQYDEESDGIALFIDGDMITLDVIMALQRHCLKLFMFHGDDFADQINAEIQEYRAQQRRAREAQEKAARRRRRETKRKESKPGFVYLIRSEKTKLYKIGRATNPQRRLQTLARDDKSLNLMHVIPCHNFVCAELDLHEDYDEKRMTGEWFDLSDHDVEVIKAIKSM